MNCDSSKFCKMADTKRMDARQRRPWPLEGMTVGHSPSGIGSSCLGPGQTWGFPLYHYHQLIESVFSRSSFCNNSSLFQISKFSCNIRDNLRSPIFCREWIALWMRRETIEWAVEKGWLGLCHRSLSNRRSQQTQRMRFLFWTPQLWHKALCLQ